MIEFHWKAYSTHTPSLLQFFVSLHLHTELNLDAHLTAQMLQSAGATETSTSDDMSVLRVCEHRRVCKRAKEWTRNARVQQWEIIAACTRVKKERERDRGWKWLGRWCCRRLLMSCSPELISLDIFDFSLRHTHGEFSPLIDCPRGSAQSRSRRRADGESMDAEWNTMSLCTETQLKESSA